MTWHIVTQAISQLKIKGPDNSTSQILPISRNKSSSGMGKEGYTKEVVEDESLKHLYVKICVCDKVACDKVVCERCVKVVVTKMVCVTKLVCDKDGV